MKKVNGVTSVKKLKMGSNEFQIFSMNSLHQILPIFKISFPSFVATGLIEVEIYQFSYPK